MLAYLADLFNLTNLLITLLIFLPLERLLPMQPAQKILRECWKNDLVYAVFNGVFIRAGVIVVILAALAARPWVPQPLRAALAGQPLRLQFIEVLLIADLGFYAAHRMFHRIPWLWRIHQIHHSIEALDWLAALRVHPLDQIITKGASLAPVFMLDFSWPHRHSITGTTATTAPPSTRTSPANCPSSTRCSAHCICRRDNGRGPTASIRWFRKASSGKCSIRWRPP